MTWRFESGAMIKMAGLQLEKDKLNHQGKQYALIGFDELTHFTREQFFYLMSRNRSMCGVKPYIRATCNPDPDSFVKELIQWYLDDDGFVIKERSGVIRYFYKQGEKINWAGSKDELMEEFEGITEYDIKSFTFISSSIYDNKILLEKDPSYLANLKAQNKVDRERLLRGNWKIRPDAGLYFKHEFFTIVDKAPPLINEVRAWDLASTTEQEGTDPDYTAGVKIGRCQQGNFYVLSAIRKRFSPSQVRSLILETAKVDGVKCKIFIPQDPGQAGKDQRQQLAKMLAGFQIHSGNITGDKITRAGGASAQAEAGNIFIVKGHWNMDFLNELQAFPTKGIHDDQLDAFADAFNFLCKNSGKAPTALVF
jgi:predicted phage terminase large subunit-like protein